MPYQGQRFWLVPATRALLAAAVVTAAAFLLYRATLLPGQDLGDTASFQAAIEGHDITPRDAYPLYFATGKVFVRTLGGEPAHALNIASAAFGALACGLLAVIVAQLTGRAAAGATAGALLAASYTFWSQAIIAEVYALHTCLMALCLLALLAWARRPTTARLAVFFAVYALGFGNHLMMILLLPGFALFLLLVAPDGPRGLIRPRIVLLALVLAALGACQYLWNLQALLHAPERTAGFLDALQDFWFDVTKADWRATMLMGIPEPRLADRFPMYWFDLRQQFGTAGVLLALLGVAWCLRRARLPGALARLSRRRVGLVLLVLFLVALGFALTYNVGDTHVFLLSSHVIVALVAGLGAAALLSGADRWQGARKWPSMALAAVLLLYPAWRAFDTYPALDRSADRRPTQFLDRLTSGLDDGRAVFAVELNWQLENGLDYYAKYTRPGLVVAHLDDVLLHFPSLVASNAEASRVIATGDSGAATIAAAYGPLFRLERDARVDSQPFSNRVGRVAAGTPYVLSLLAPYPNEPVDVADLNRAVARLTGGTVSLSPGTRYTVIAGRVGERPTLVYRAQRPTRLAGKAGDLAIDVRLECWLPADTIRRMGFGSVIAGRGRVLTMDRGASFAALDRSGHATAVEYGWGLLSPKSRWLVRLR